MHGNQNPVHLLHLNDGSNFEGLQVVIDANLPNYHELIPQLTTAASVAVTGTIVQSPGKEQAFELKAEDVELIGACPAEEYPLQKKHHTLEFLRTIAHLRPRTNTISAVARVRNSLVLCNASILSRTRFSQCNDPHYYCLRL